MKLTARTMTFVPALALAFALPIAAQAATAITDGRAVLRAGPGNDYPRVDTIRGKMRVNVHGCIARYDWCDVSMGRMRGWMSGDDLTMLHRGRTVRMHDYGPRMSIPTVTFRFDSYWDNNYRTSGFYRERDNYRRLGIRDQDRDGVPNAFDRDRDGDGVRNNRDNDRDGDGVRNRNDPRPNNPRVD